MHPDIKKGIMTGVERISAWVDLLDRINVYPVADGDTGRNLKISLSPLRQLDRDPEKALHSLMLSARGNSGNIAARFFAGLLKAGSIDDIPDAVKTGRDNAWEAVHNPKEGTMLSVFNTLADILINKNNIERTTLFESITDHLEKTVNDTVEQLPRLKEANVVDAGALGMYIFFEGFFNTLTKNDNKYKPVTEIFKDKLTISQNFREIAEPGYCVDMVLETDDEAIKAVKELKERDESVIVINEDNYIKVHFHTENKSEARKKIESYGNIVKWDEDDLEIQMREFARKDLKNKVHIMTDAAGSITRNDASRYGLTLLDSYVLFGDKCVPETHLIPDELYGSMLNGVKASTSQASDFERHQYYQSALSLYNQVLYLCVGSVYTGNYEAAIKWKKDNDTQDRFRVLDTGTASGRLALIVLATARYSEKSQSFDDLINYARRVIDRCQEYIFLEKLQYLASGGRMSKTGAFFGDILNVKPIVSPMPDGAGKVGVARNKKDQIKFLLDKLSENLNPDNESIIMIEYTDNRNWVEQNIKNKIQNIYPDSEIILQPLSLTTGVHTGPGTWAVAFLDTGELEK